MQAPLTVYGSKLSPALCFLCLPVLQCLWTAGVLHSTGKGQWVKFSDIFFSVYLAFSVLLPSFLLSSVVDVAPEGFLSLAM